MDDLSMDDVIIRDFFNEDGSLIDVQQSNESDILLLDNEVLTENV